MNKAHSLYGLIGQWIRVPDGVGCYLYPAGIKQFEVPEFESYRGASIFPSLPKDKSQALGLRLVNDLLFLNVKA